MKAFLEKLKLIDHLTTDLTISKLHFVEQLSSVTDKGSTGAFSSPFDVFSSSKNEFRGEVTYEGFKIKKRKKLFDRNMNIAVATGSFTEQNGVLKIETEINGFNNFFIPFFIIMLLAFSMFLFSMSKAENDNNSFVFPFLILYAYLMFGIPYFMMRRSVKRLRYDLEREFYYLAKQ